MIKDRCIIIKKIWMLTEFSVNSLTFSSCNSNSLAKMSMVGFGGGFPKISGDVNGDGDGSWGRSRGKEERLDLNLFIER